MAKQAEGVTQVYARRAMLVNGRRCLPGDSIPTSEFDGERLGVLLRTGHVQRELTADIVKRREAHERTKKGGSAA